MSKFYARQLIPAFARAALYRQYALDARVKRLAKTLDRLSLSCAQLVRRDTEAAMSQPIGTRAPALDRMFEKWDRRSAIISAMFNLLDDLRRACRAHYRRRPAERRIIPTSVRRPYRA